MANISDYYKVRSHLLVKIHIPEYKINSTDTAQDIFLTFSDLNRDNTIVYDGLTYVGLGAMMSVTASNSELNPSSSELTITVTGIPDGSITQILNSKIKGASVWIYRLFFDADTGAYLEVEQNPLARFRGFVNNYSLVEEYDINTRTSKNTSLFICKSSLDVLQNKISGRMTNPTSEKRYFPNDLGFDRVPSIQDTAFNFGAPK
jgi:hypothetical protein